MVNCDKSNVLLILEKSPIMGVIRPKINIATLIDSLPGRPLIVGHSMAGMAALKLLELEKAAAAVSIDGAPSKLVRNT